MFSKNIPTGFVCLLLLLLGQGNIRAAELRPETLEAWKHYIQATDADMKARLSSEKPFLWVEEDRSRASRLKNGEMQVGPAREHGSTVVPGGLIHHWVGAAFIPDTSLEQVLHVTRNYERYKDYFNPEVIDSRLIEQLGDEDQFSVKWVTKILFVSAGINTQCHSHSVRLDDQRAYTTSVTTRVQEVQDYGRDGERELPPDQGDGYIWRLYNLTRYEARDGGVYVEIEALALTRDIPGSLRLMVGPVIKRVSRNSLLLSLRQTRDAVIASQESARNSGPGRLAGRLPNAPGALTVPRQAIR